MRFLGHPVCIHNDLDLIAGSGMTPVCLPSPYYSPPDNSLATVTGFGTTDENSDQPSPRLLTVDVNIISNNDCINKNTIYSSRVKGTMICAGVLYGGGVGKEVLWNQ